jgi:FkbM family methyltransferase
MNASVNFAGFRDIAEGKPATQSSRLPGSDRSNAEIDASTAITPNMPDGSYFHTNHEFAPWWQVDLQDTFAIRRVCLYNRQEYQDRLRFLKVLVSIAGEVWTIIHCKDDDDVFGDSENSNYVVNFDNDIFARFIRVQKTDFGCLHLSRVKVFGDKASIEARTFAEDREMEKLRKLRAGRSGHVQQIGGFQVFVDTDHYSADVIGTLATGTYEARERGLVAQLVHRGDRVLEAGTAIGVVSMVAASIVGAANISTFDANPQIAADAKRNFEFNDLPIDSSVGVLRNRSKWNENEIATNFYISKNFVSSRLYASAGAPDVIATVRIPYACLEDEIKKARANVLICDIEGGEADLLLGADLSGIRLIILETHYWAVGHDAIDNLVRYLIEQDFRIDLDLTALQVAVFRRSLES